MKRLTLSVLLAGCFVEIISANLDTYLPSLFEMNKSKLVSVLSSTSAELFKDNGIDTKNQDNVERIHTLLFYHLLFTTTGAVDCKRGGILEIPYFWHWCDPNPRYDIRYIPESKKLNRIKPPKGYEKYKSYADIDRTPSIYLKNLFAESPLFRHPVCGTIYTFGWCSEREMAFNCLLSILGYECKIKQEGIHVWSEIVIILKDVKAKQKRYIVKVDNTFNGFEIKRMTGTKDTWKRDYGNGAQVKWYNQRSRSPREKQSVGKIVITKKVNMRIQKNVTEWLNKL